MDLKEELSQHIDFWLQSKRNVSLQVLARLTGVSYSTLRRIVQRDVQASLENTMQIISVLMPEDEALAFLKRHYADFQLLFRHQDPDAPAVAIEQRDDFLLFALATSRRGMTLLEAERRLGERAHTAVENLANRGVLRFEGDRYFAKKSLFSPQGMHDLRFLSWLLELFDRRRLGRWGAFVKVRTEGLSAEALQQAHQIMEESFDRLDKLMQDPQNFGPYVMGYGLVSTLLGAGQFAERDLI